MAEGSKRSIKCRPSGFTSRDWQASRVRYAYFAVARLPFIAACYS